MDVKHIAPKYKYKNPEIFALGKKKKPQNLFWIKKPKQQCSFCQAL